MKPMYHLVIILLLWLVPSLCTCHPVLGGYHRNNNIQCIDTERDALLHFKHGLLNYTCGMLTSWASHTDCCRWHGVICSNLTGHVVKLSLVGYESCWLDGQVSPSLGELKHLKHLNISNNYFDGEIPHQLGNLSKLTTLDLSNNYFFGEISHQLGNLSKLTTLDLGYSGYYFPIKSLSWISRLTLLRYLDLSGANFSEVRNWIAIVNNLASLRVLSLNDCHLSTEIPSSISYVNSSATLQSISLSGISFTDDSIFQLLFNLPRITTQLVHLDLSYFWNAFGSPIPSEIGNLHSLSYLDLSASGFKGPIPSEIWNLSSLSCLNLSRNDFDGLIPSEFENLHSLSCLDLSYNNFDGLIPREIGNLHSLSYLDLSNNGIQVPIPSEIGKLHSLSYLSLSDNSIPGSVSKTLSQLSNLKHLNLRNNSFNEELSNVIHSLSKCNNKVLFRLDLSFNRFWGGIPEYIGSLSSLKELNLRDNQLEGEISPGIGQLTMLEIWDVTSNSLEGTLTRNHFSSLVNLRELRLSYNLGFEISIEEDWIPPFNLDVIQLRSCKLGPRFPKWLQLQSNFSYFDVSNTSISDSIHVPFWNSLSPNLLYLNMSNNQLYGMLPNRSQWRTFSKSFTIIDLSSNMIEGVVPSAFTKTWSLYLNDNRFSNCSKIIGPNTENNLEILDLSNNLFSGELPDCWINFKGLRSLHLENNKFSGQIPKSISTLSGLRYLHLYNNSFSGPFPVAFENLTSLVILNIGYNSFSGNIPSWIGNAFQILRVLILRENHFIGEIPQTICQLYYLQILDLAINHISGVIPSCIEMMMEMQGIQSLQFDFELDETSYGNETRIESVIVSWKREEQRFKKSIKFVRYIDFSGNELSGEIPDEISSLTALGALDLSKNNFRGYIPSEIGNLEALEFLDLSNNHLTGEIPISLAEVTTLDVMDLSNNNLSGEIPVSTQLQSFDASSYAGNPRLCGAPLPSCSKDQAPYQYKDEDEDHIDFFLGLYVSVVLGFIVGFWGVCGTLFIKTSWRYAYFRLLDNIKERIM